MPKTAAENDNPRPHRRLVLIAARTAQLETVNQPEVSQHNSKKSLG